MTDWIDTETRRPEIGPEGRSDLVEFDSGEGTVPCLGYLDQYPNGKLWWRSLGPTPGECSEPQPAGYASKRWIKRWRPHESG